eukprot:4251017-Prymnesium_polylepis.1
MTPRDDPNVTPMPSGGGAAAPRLRLHRLRVRHFRLGGCRRRVHGRDQSARRAVRRAEAARGATAGARGGGRPPRDAPMAPMWTSIDSMRSRVTPCGPRVTPCGPRVTPCDPV